MLMTTVLAVCRSRLAKAGIAGIAGIADTAHA